MGDALNWTVDQYVLLGVTLALFAFVGYRRGANRELLSMAGIGLGMLISARAAVALQPQVNRYYRMLRFALGGGLSASDPSAAWSSASQLPPLVTTAAHLQTLALCVFIVIVIVFYLLGQRFFPRATSFVMRFLGLLAGGINGFLASSYVYPTVLNKPKAVITVPGEQVRATLSNSQNVAFVLVFFAVVLVAFGLYNAGSNKRR